MGLDMYLNCRKAIYQRDWAPEGQPLPVLKTEDGMKIVAYETEAAYWRKHPDLHGYIVQTFAGGVDECQPIQLDAIQLRDIAKAIRANKLPHTDGFFFGSSDWHRDDVEKNAAVFERTADWLDVRPEGGSFETRSVYYQASW